MSDILEAIDAAVGGKCACGCGQPLDPNGASMWFAGPSCQQRYLERQATDPHDVYCWCAIGAACWTGPHPLSLGAKLRSTSTKL
jgi:hypothetical protein